MAPLTNICLRFVTLLGLGSTLTAAFSHPGVAFRPASSALQAKIATYLDDGNYNQIMLGDDKYVLVDACAQWCGPCKLIEPFLEQSAAKYEDRLQIVKMDVEAKDNGAAKVEFLMQGVMPQALPSLLLFKNGKHVATHNGALKQEELDEFIETNLRLASEKKVATDSAPSQKKGFISFGGMQDDYALQA